MKAINISIVVLLVYFASVATTGHSRRGSENGSEDETTSARHSKEVDNKKPELKKSQSKSSKAITRTKPEYFYSEFSFPKDFYSKDENDKPVLKKIRHFKHVVGTVFYALILEGVEETPEKTRKHTHHYFLNCPVSKDKKSPS